MLRKTFWQSLWVLLGFILTQQIAVAQNDLISVNETISAASGGQITSNPGSNRSYVSAGGNLTLQLHGDFQRNLIDDTYTIFRNTGENVRNVDEHNLPVDGWWYEIVPSKSGLFSGVFLHKNAGRKLFFYSEDGVQMLDPLTAAQDNDRLEFADVPVEAGKRYYIYTMTSQNLGLAEITLKTERNGWNFSKSVEESGLYGSEWESVSGKDGYLFYSQPITPSSNVTIKDASGADLFPGVTLSASGTTIDAYRFAYYVKGGAGSTAGLSEDRNGDDGKDYLLHLSGLQTGTLFTLNGRASGALDITPVSGITPTAVSSFTNNQTVALNYEVTGSDVVIRIGRRLYLKSVVLTNQKLPTVSFPQSTMELYEGQQTVVTAAVENTTKGVGYGSTNTAVATVDENGHITAVAEGTAIIYARAGSASASILLTVRPMGVTVSPNGGTYSTDRLDISIVGDLDDTYYQVTDNASAPSIGGSGWIKGNSYTAENRGNFYIHAYTTDGVHTSSVKTTPQFVFTPSVAVPEITVGGNTYTGTANELSYHLAPVVGMRTETGYTLSYKVGDRSYTTEELLAANSGAIAINGVSGTWQYGGDKADRYLTVIAVRTLSNGQRFGSEPTVLHLKWMDLEDGKRWDFRSWTDADRAVLNALDGVFTVSGTNYTFNNALTDYSISGIPQLEGVLLTTYAGNTRFQAAPSNGNITEYTSAVKFPILKEQTFKFAANAVGNPCPYRIDFVYQDGTSTRTLYTSPDADRISRDNPIDGQIEVTAPADGWIAIQGTNIERAFYFRWAEITSPHIASPIIHILKEVKTNQSVDHDGTGVNIAVSSNDEDVKIWYQWSGTALTEEQLEENHVEAASNYVALEWLGAQSQVLTAMIVKDFGDRSYNSDVSTLTLNYKNNYTTAEKIYLDGPHSASDSIWVKQDGYVYPRENYGDYYNWRTAIRWVTLNWNEQVPSTYFVDFDIKLRSTSAATEKQKEFKFLLKSVADRNIIELNHDQSNNNNSYILTAQKDGSALQQNITLTSQQWYHFRYIVNKNTNRVLFTITSGQGTSGSVVFADYVDLLDNEAKGLYHVIPDHGGFWFDNYELWFEREDVGDEYIVFSKKNINYDLLDMYFNEPDLKFEPAEATIEYTVDNTSIATVGDVRTDNPNIREIQFFDGGKVDVTGHLMVDGVEKATSSYQVTVKAEPANYDVVGNTYTLTNRGKLIERTVTMVPGITMEFGNTADKIGDAKNLNMTLVKDLGDGLVAQTLANNGWRDFQNEGGSTALHDVPKEGSYLTFKPVIGGKLTINAARSSVNNEVVMVDATDNTYHTVTPVSGSFGAANVLSDISYTLEANHTYYIYGKNPFTAGGSGNRNGSDWTVVQLHAFSFEPEFYFEKPYDQIALETFKNSGYSQPINKVNAESGTYEIWDSATKSFSGSAGGTGDIRAAINSTTGALTYVSGTGGAVIVKCTSGGSYYATYVLTVPYESHKWDFTAVEGAPSPTFTGREVNMNVAKDELTQLISDWSVTYKVRNYTTDGTQMLYYLNKPVMTNNQPLNGNNAMYVDETAGLIVNGSAKSFGVDVTELDDVTPRDELLERVKNGEYADRPADYTDDLNTALRSMLAYTKEEVKNPKLVTVNKYATITIPQLKEGQYIRMHLNRHGPESGKSLLFTTPNVEGVGSTVKSGTVVIDGAEVPVCAFQITGVNIYNSNNQEAGYAVRNDDGTYNLVGNYIFRVTADGDVSFRVDDNGWVDIYDIEVSSQKFETELRIVSSAGTEFTLANTGFCYNSDSSQPVKAEVEFSTSSSSVRSVRAVTPVYRLGHVDSTVNALMDGSTLKINGGVGNLQVIEEVMDESGQVVIDRRELWFAVAQVETQEYPKTWDFTAENMDGSPVHSVYADRNATNGKVSTPAGSDDAEKTYGAWDGSNLVTVYEVQDGNGETVSKPVFVSGAQLTAGTRAIEETIGLGVGLTDGLSQLDADAIVLDGTSLKIKKSSAGTPFIRIPGVKDSQRVYLSASQTPVLTVSGGTADETTDANTGNGSYGWTLTTGNDEGETLQFTFPDDVEIYRIGITDITKTVNELGYSTESRRVTIDHRLTGEFTVNDVNAYVIPEATYDEGTATVSKQEVNVVPPNTGVLLYKADADGANRTMVPLFREAVNIVPSSAEETQYATNMLRPHVDAETNTFVDETEDEDGTGHGSEGKYTRFGLTRSYYTYHASTGTYEENPQDDHMSFIRMKGNNSGAFGANLAYLRVENVPVALWNESGIAGVAGRIFFDDDRDAAPGGDTTAIDNNLTVNRAQPFDSIYTLDGRKVALDSRHASLNSLPKGIYIINGKKVVIK